MLELLEIRQLTSDRVGRSEAERQSQEVVLARGALQVTEERLELGPQCGVALEQGLGELGQLGPLLRAERTEQRPCRGHLAGQGGQKFVKVGRGSGHEVSVAFHEPLEVGLYVGARLTALDHAVELGQHLPARSSTSGGVLEMAAWSSEKALRATFARCRRTRSSSSRSPATSRPARSLKPCWTKRRSA